LTSSLNIQIQSHEKISNNSKNQSTYLIQAKTVEKSKIAEMVKEKVQIKKNQN
jgi:hypothetical protein